MTYEDVRTYGRQERPTSGGGWTDLFGKLDNLQGRAGKDFLDGDYRQPRAGDGAEPAPTRPTERVIHASARLIAFDVLNDATSVPERSAFALVDTAASWLIHGGGEETARLALEAVTTPAVAGDVVRVLTGDGGSW